jgi:hypothetical protein
VVVELRVLLQQRGVVGHKPWSVPWRVREGQVRSGRRISPSNT